MQKSSWPLADALQVWLRTKQAFIGQKIKLADAICYALSHGRSREIWRPVQLKKGELSR
jgi:hypothetical protein